MICGLSTCALSPTELTEAQYIDCFQKIKFSFNLLVCGSLSLVSSSETMPRLFHFQLLLTLGLSSQAQDKTDARVLVKVAWGAGSDRHCPMSPGEAGSGVAGDKCPRLRAHPLPCSANREWSGNMVEVEGEQREKGRLEEEWAAETEGGCKPVMSSPTQPLP